MARDGERHGGRERNKTSQCKTVGKRQRQTARDEKRQENMK